MPRRKLTEAPAINGEDLPDLTRKQRAYVEARLSGLGVVAAYRSAYDCAGAADATVWGNASRVEHNSKIAAWLDAAKAAGLNACARTLERHIGNLDRLQVQAVRSGNMGAAVQAEQLAGKASGLYIDRLEITDRRRPEPLAQLHAIARDYGLEVAETIARVEGAKAGLPEPAVDSIIERLQSELAAGNAPQKPQKAVTAQEQADG